MKQNLNLLIQFIKTKEMVLLSLLLSLVSQLSHSVYAYVNLSLHEVWYETLFQVVIGLTFALGVSFAILINTINGNKQKAYIYLFIEFLINLIYYKAYLLSGGWILLITQSLFAFIMPYTISSYSELIEKDKLEEEKNKEDLDKENKNLLEKFDSLEKEINFAKESNLKEEDVKRILSDSEVTLTVKDTEYKNVKLNIE
jgi:hypothetical protein